MVSAMRPGFPHGGVSYPPVFLSGTWRGDQISYPICRIKTGFNFFKNTLLNPFHAGNSGLAFHLIEQQEMKIIRQQIPELFLIADFNSIVTDKSPDRDEILFFKREIRFFLIVQGAGPFRTLPEIAEKHR